MREVAEIVGLICLVAFTFFVWPPLALASAGIILFAGAHAYKTEETGRAVHIAKEPK